MYRKPHEKGTYKSIKKIDPQKEKLLNKQQNTKFVAKPAPNMKNPPKISVRQRIAPSNNKTVPQKVQQLQKIVDKIQKTKGNEQLQQLLLKQIQGIKSQLKQIKNQIGMKNQHNYHHSAHQQEQQIQNVGQEQQEQEQNIMNLNKPNGHQLRQIPTYSNNSNLNIESHINHDNFQQSQSRPKISNNFNKNVNKKVLIDIGKIQPYMKQFKLQPQSKQPQPFYYGYHKKSSKPVIVKYCQENQNMDFLIGIYQKLWKNIVKAKTICINKIYDLNQPLANYIIVLEQNKCGLEAIQMPPFKIAQEILKALQFFHQCGYLYRNIHPQHVMMNYQNNIVLIDLKKMKRFVDMKGKVLEVKAGDEQIDEFVSNSRIRGALQGRKDDLQCLGYLTLYMLQGKLPWTLESMIQIRSKLTLNQIFGKYPGLLKFMIEVQKLPTQQMPNYSMLNDFLN